MSNYTYEQIKEVVFKWIQSDITSILARDDYIEISKNEKEVLLIDLTFKDCLAQIVVSKPTFAPYQYVSFEAMTLDSKKAQETGQPELVYFFYDFPEMKENEVLEELNFGIKLCSEYIPDQLSKVYLNKNGILTIKNENLYHIIHPDDIKRYNKQLIGDSFVCKDIECQYLVIKNELVSLRVLPQVFIKTP